MKSLVWSLMLEMKSIVRLPSFPELFYDSIRVDLVQNLRYNADVWGEIPQDDDEDFPFVGRPLMKQKQQAWSEQNFFYKAQLDERFWRAWDKIGPELKEAANSLVAKTKLIFDGRMEAEFGKINSQANEVDANHDDLVLASSFRFYLHHQVLGDLVRLGVNLIGTRGKLVKFVKDVLELDQRQPAGQPVIPIRPTPATMNYMQALFVQV